MTNRIRFVGQVTDSTAVPAGTEVTITWEQQFDGIIKLQEVAVAFDAVLQADGVFTLRIGGQIVADQISALSTDYGFGFDNMETLLAKGETVELTIYNSGANPGTAQLLVNAYEEAA
jgi:hypothetical protein